MTDDLQAALREWLQLGLYAGLWSDQLPERLERLLRRAMDNIAYELDRDPAEYPVQRFDRAILAALQQGQDDGKV